MGTGMSSSSSSTAAAVAEAAAAEAAAPSSSSLEKKSNFARLCWLLIDTGTQVLREVFDNIHKPTSLHAVLQSTSVHNTLRQLKSRRILNTQQWSKLYPSRSTSVSSASFDVTLLFALLRNICNLTPPPTGWDKPPAASDLSKEADLARIKWYRNEVYAHRTETTVSDADFEKLWTEISAVLIRLGGQDYKTSIQRLKVEPMDSDDEKHFIKMLEEWKQLEDELPQKMDEVLKPLKEGKPVAASASEAKGATNVTNITVTVEKGAQAAVGTKYVQFISNVENPTNQPALERDHFSSRAQGLETVSQAATTALCDTTPTFNLNDNQKRWIVVGICLNKTLLPDLRDFLAQEMIKHYDDLKANRNIHNQNLQEHLKKDGRYNFNYGNINNNKGKERTSFDFDVKSEVDLGKLYLKPFMAKFTGFDDTCDLSAVLGILSSASVFSSKIQDLALKVKDDVRNEFAHCNFNTWDDTKFRSCFQLMDSLIRELKLTPDTEERITDELKNWEARDVQLCIGNMDDDGLRKFVQFWEDGIKSLSEEVKSLGRSQEEKEEVWDKRITEALLSIKEAFDKDKEEIYKTIEANKRDIDANERKIEGIEIALKTDKEENLKRKEEGTVETLKDIEADIPCKCKGKCAKKTGKGACPCKSKDRTCNQSCSCDKGKCKNQDRAAIQGETTRQTDTESESSDTDSKASKKGLEDIEADIPCKCKGKCAHKKEQPNKLLQNMDEARKVPKGGNAVAASASEAEAISGNGRTAHDRDQSTLSTESTSGSAEKNILSEPKAQDTPSTSQDTGNETETISEVLTSDAETGGRTSPLQSTLNTEWDDIPPTQKECYLRKAKEMIAAALSEVAPGQERQLWESLRRDTLLESETSDAPQRRYSHAFSPEEPDSKSRTSDGVGNMGWARQGEQNEEGTTEEDIEASEAEGAHQDLRVAEIQKSKHPILVTLGEEFNICDLSQTGELENLEIAKLKWICSELGLHIQGPKTTKKSFLTTLEELARDCTCRK